MKLAEALLLRAEYQTRLAETETRILNNLKIQEGEEPDEDPNVLIKEAMELNVKLCELVTAINRANNTTMLQGGQTIAEALAQREMLNRRRALIIRIIEKAAQRDYRLTRSEIKMLTTVKIASLQAEADALAKEFREIDTQIQAQNWLTDMADF